MWRDGGMRRVYGHGQQAAEKSEQAELDSEAAAVRPRRGWAGPLPRLLREISH